MSAPFHAPLCAAGDRDSDGGEEEEEDEEDEEEEMEGNGSARAAGRRRGKSSPSLGGRPMPSSAARLLTRLLLHFPYALPEESLQRMLTRLTAFAHRCMPSAATGGGAAPTAATATDADERAHELRPLLHMLWAAANAVLRRQAADCAELLWAPPHGFVQSAELHRWIEWAVRRYCSTRQPLGSLPGHYAAPTPCPPLTLRS